MPKLVQSGLKTHKTPSAVGPKLVQIMNRLICTLDTDGILTFSSLSPANLRDLPLDPSDRAELCANLAHKRLEKSHRGPQRSPRQETFIPENYVASCQPQLRVRLVRTCAQEFHDLRLEVPEPAE